MDHMDELNFKRWIRRVSARSGANIEKSHIYMSIFSTNFKQDPQCALELGIAIMLDKPIALLVPEGDTIPSGLKKIAAAIEYVNLDDPLSMKKATEALLKKIKK